MKRFKKMLVIGNDLENNSFLVEYAFRMGRLADAKELHFLFLHQGLALPPALIKRYPELAFEGRDLASVTEVDINRRRASADRFTVSVGLHDVSDLGYMLDLVEKMDIDLVIIEKECGQGAVPERLARKAPCSVMILPHGHFEELARIVVPIDFSEGSGEALEAAAAIAAAAGLDRVLAIHAVTVPTGYHATGRSYEEFLDILMQNAREEFAELIKKTGAQGVRIDFEAFETKKPVDGIRQFAGQHNSDLMVVGARGMSKTAAILLGNTTELLIRLCDRPLLVVKKKGAGSGLLRHLLGMRT